MKLFHIVATSDWEPARVKGCYRASSLDSEGFIHLSTEAQWLRVANTFYRGGTDLLLLVLEANRLGPALRFDTVGEEQFPHLYGELPVDAVIAEHVLETRPDGSFLSPAGIRGIEGPAAPTR